MKRWCGKNHRLQRVNQVNWVIPILSHYERSNHTTPLERSSYMSAAGEIDTSPMLLIQTSSLHYQNKLWSLLDRGCFHSIAIMGDLQVRIREWVRHIAILLDSWTCHLLWQVLSSQIVCCSSDQEKEVEFKLSSHSIAIMGDLQVRIREWVRHIAILLDSWTCHLLWQVLSSQIVCCSSDQEKEVEFKLSSLSCTRGCVEHKTLKRSS